MRSRDRSWTDGIQLTRQRRLLRVVLLCMIAYGGFIGFVNLTLLALPMMAIFDLVVMVLALGTLLFLRHSENLRAASWAAILILSGVVLAFCITARGANYSLLWLTVPPPLAFALLGSRSGARFSGLFVLLAVIGMALTYRDMPVRPLGAGAVFNFAEVLLAHWLVLRFNERSREEAYARLRELAQFDGLTGLANRKQFEEELRRTLLLARRTGTETALLFVDLDHFKTINDAAGHAAGDEVLVRVGELLRDSVRASDQLGRWGGEEFLVLCPDTDRAGAAALAEKIRLAIEQDRGICEPGLTASIGVAVSADDEETVDSLVARADAALYRAKESGRNRVAGGPVAT